MGLSVRTYMDGNQHCAVLSDFINLQESPAGFGNTAEDAEFKLRLAVRPANVCWHHGDPMDVVGCPFNLCQAGRIAMWRMGLPAGVEICGICKGRGLMYRKDAKAAVLRLDDMVNPPCICWALHN